MDLIGEGLTNKQIAARMFLAEKTLKNYVSRLLAKLGMERRTQAAVFISETGPIPPPPRRVSVSGRTGHDHRHPSRLGDRRTDRTEQIPAEPPRPWLPTTVNWADSDCSSS